MIAGLLVLALIAIVMLAVVVVVLFDIADTLHMIDFNLRDLDDESRD